MPSPSRSGSPDGRADSRRRDGYRLRRKTLGGGTVADDRDRGAGRTDEVRRAYDASPLPMATTAGPGHVYVACNAAYRRHTGADGLVGRAHADTVTGPAGDRIARLLDRAWTSHQPTAAGGLYAAPYRDADGARRRRAPDPGRRAVGRRSGPVIATQDALLPADLPVVPGLDLAGRYLLAADGSAGGDWFDVVVRPDGRLALVVGDVVGHGVPAYGGHGTAERRAPEPAAHRPTPRRRDAGGRPVREAGGRDAGGHGLRPAARSRGRRRRVLHRRPPAAARGRRARRGEVPGAFGCRAAGHHA